ncbi:hypothetical protein [Variovorax sp. RCC_210]|uniref:hypothetical protein n=1 Tax=Variovorax sp. RCC_210 TaxID=3239217 RepID=UPI0035241F58
MNPISYLVWLQKERLPVSASTTPEIRHVSVLKAAGLVEASIVGPADSRGRYWPAVEAVVLRITDHGLDVIKEHLTPRCSTSAAPVDKEKVAVMYLRSIEDGSFPVRVEDSNAVRHLVLLKAAGYVEANFSETHRLADDRGRSAQATILCITLLGRSALEASRH